MFGGIAPRYDLLNRLLSLRRDVRWRREAAAELPEDPGARVLDLCGGTGDLSVEAAAAGRAGLVVCCDFSHPMIALAPEKFRRRGVAERCVVLEADGLRLPFADDTFDACTVAFGVRNFADPDAGFREILRVLRPAGRLVVLEFSRPEGPLLSRAYGLYLRRVLPLVGDRISGREGPYRYLARTISGFPAAPALAGRMREAGFAAVGWRTLTGGIVAIHTAVKAARAVVRSPEGPEGQLSAREGGSPPARR
jgi:demethylmenaquinone methyltransferase/2-methoxy-6-polyprenyl-1,4-benzoquinol methylase